MDSFLLKSIMGGDDGGVMLAIIQGPAARGAAGGGLFTCSLIEVDVFGADQLLADSYLMASYPAWSLSIELALGFCFASSFHPCSLFIALFHFKNPPPRILSQESSPKNPRIKLLL